MIEVTACLSRKHTTIFHRKITLMALGPPVSLIEFEIL